MAHFADYQHVWLRSRVHGTYLYADKDGHGVSLSSHRMSMKAAWVVHLYFRDVQHVLLRSAAYGSYLSAVDALAPIGCRGFRVAQRNYDVLEDAAVRWEPVMMGSEGVILLRQAVAVDGRRHGHLRANGRHLPWNDDYVSVDFSPVTTMMEWVVAPIPTRERIPRLPHPPRFELSILLLSRVVTGNGEGYSRNNVPFNFRGKSVFRLRKELIRQLGIGPDVPENLVVMYVQAGRFGRLTPLVVNLPRTRQALVITADTSGNGWPRYPDFALPRGNAEQVS